MMMPPHSFVAVSASALSRLVRDVKMIGWAAVPSAFSFEPRFTTKFDSLIDPKTVTRWAKSGKLTSIRTLGGHRRYREAEVRALLAGIPQPRSS